MTASAVCERCGRELAGGLPSPCAVCSAAPAWTPEAGYGHAAGLLAAAERAEAAAARARSERAEEAARELLLASLDRVVELLPSSHEWVRRSEWIRRSDRVPPSCSIVNPHRRAAAIRRAHLDGLCEAPGDSPYTDLDSEARFSA